MASELDFLDDDFLEQAANAVRAAGKFRPKAKFGPKSGNRPAKLSTIPADANVAESAALACSSNDLPKLQPCSTATTDLLSKVPAAAEPLAKCSDIIGSGGYEDSGRSVSPASMEADRMHSHDVENLFSGPSVLNSSWEFQAESEKSSREGEYLFTSAESLQDDPFHSAHSTGVDFVSLPPELDAEALNQGSSGSSFPSTFSLVSPMVAPCNPKHIDASSEYADGVLLDATLRMGHEHLEKEEATRYSCLELLDSDAYGLDLSSDNRVSQFGPEEMTFVSTKISSASTLPEESVPVCSSKGTELLPSESEPFEESLSSFTPNTPAHSSIWQSYKLPAVDSSSNISEMQEAASLAGTILSDKPKDTNEVPENEAAKSRKLRKRVSFHGITNETENGPAEISVTIVTGKQLQVVNEVAGISEENESTKLSRKTRKRVPSHGTIDESETVEDGQSQAIHETENVEDEQSESNADRDDDPLYSMEDDISKLRRSTKKRKISATDVDKKVRGHKKASEGHGSVNSEKSKQKFSHSTRRSRKLVNKELLETPEDEIDPKKTILKDLILLAEIKERKMIKDAAALKKSTTDKRDGGEGVNSDDGQARPKLNYHSFMVKTPRERWSAADSQVFYEAIRQFGTDFAMIQQIFPGRSRHQVKLKYKAEERKHPIQIADALMQRSKDRSHFELVMERLRAQAEQDSNRGSESPAPSGENEEVDDYNGGAEVSGTEKHDIAEEKEVAENWQHTEVCSPGKAEEMEDAYDWSNYKSFDEYSFDDT